MHIDRSERVNSRMVRSSKIGSGVYHTVAPKNSNRINRPKDFKSSVFDVLCSVDFSRGLKIKLGDYISARFTIVTGHAARGLLVSLVNSDGMNMVSEDGTTEQRGKTLCGSELIKIRGLRAVLCEDFQTHRREFAMPGFQALFVYRVGVWATTLPRLARLPFDIFYALGFRFCRAFYGIELQRSVNIGRRFFIGHQHGIVVHAFATFGDDCTIRQGVTLGVADKWEPGVGPIIGNNVSFSPGCIVIGNVTIGNNVQVGPNCVVSTDVPSDRILFVPPPRSFPREAGRSQNGDC